MGYVREHLALIGKGFGAVSGAGGFVGAYGLYQLIATTHHRSGWFWLFLGVLILLLVEIRTAHRALIQRDSAAQRAQTITQQLVAVESGANVQDLDVLDNLMTLQVGGPGAAVPKSRLWARRLSNAQRLDLANRLETCSGELLEWLHVDRAEPYEPFPSDEKEREAQKRRQYEHRTTTRGQFFTRFAYRSRDLLNECREAGHSLDGELEQFRTSGWANQLTMGHVGQGLGILALRVHRKAKRLP